MKAKKLKTYKMISDPGHGWLSVSLKEIKEFGLEDKISSYSYMTKSRAYLEEDQDASFFIEELKKREIPFEIKESHVDKTPIRNYASFSKETMDFAMNVSVGTQLFLYNSSDKQWNTPAVITKIEGTEYHLDSYSNRYKVSEYKLLSHTKPMPPEFKNTFQVNSNSIKFNVRIVFNGDSYGLNNCLTHDRFDPLVEFYDTRYNHTKLGQFVSRYYASTLLESKNEGLLLDTGTPDWMLSKQAFNKVVFTLSENMNVLKGIEQSKLDSELNTVAKTPRKFNI